MSYRKISIILACLLCSIFSSLQGEMIFSKCVINNQYLGIWPNFCSHHLSTDPAGCSSWSIAWDNNTKGYQLEQHGDHYLFADASIDPELIKRAKKYLEYIPPLPEDRCDYAQCMECGKTVLRSLIVKSWKEEMPAVEHLHESYSIDVTALVPVHTCECFDKFIDLENLEVSEKAVVAHWRFCHCPAIYYGYFDKCISEKFDNFMKFLNYSAENPKCQCHWYIISEEITKLLREINSDFFIFSQRDWDYESDADDLKTALKEEDFPYMKFYGTLLHSVFYSDLEEAIYQFDFSIFWKRSHYEEEDEVNAEIMRNFVQDLLSKIRPKYLELYKECYIKHPHQKISEEIELLQKEITSEEPRESFPAL